MTADKLRGKLGAGAAKDSGEMSEFDISELLREYMSDSKNGESPEAPDAKLFDAASTAGEDVPTEKERTRRAMHTGGISFGIDFPDANVPDNEDTDEYFFEEEPVEEAYAENAPTDTYDEPAYGDEAAADETYIGEAYADDAYVGESYADEYNALPDPACFEDESPDDGYADGAYDDSGADAGEYYPAEEYGDAEEIADANTSDDAGDDGGFTLPENMDETDINLMVALGLEEELAKTVGTKTAEKLTEKIENEHMERLHSEERDPSKEFTSADQIPEIVSSLRKAYAFSKIRLVLGAILLLVTAFYENLTLFGVQFGGALDPAVYPVVYVMADLQLVLFACGLSFDLIKNGFFNLFKGRISPESITFVMAIASVLHSVWLAATATVPNEPVLYNLPVVLCMFMSMLFAHWRIKREIFSFNIVSTEGPKYIIRRLGANDAASEAEAVDDNDAGAGDVLKIEKTDFVDGFFKRMNARVYSNSAFIVLALILSVALAAVTAVFTGFSSRSGSPMGEAINVLYMGVVAALPLSMFFTYGYPFYKANKEAYENDSTIVGENSLEEYTGASLITFDDKNVFPSYGVKVQNVRIYNNYRIDKVLYYATSVFKVTEGPLGEVFSVATAEMGHSDDVEIIDTGSGYIEASVDGKNIIFGRAADLVELGVNIPSQIIEEDENIDEELSVMYMIYQQQLVAKMHVRYIIDPDFEYILRRLSSSGMCVCVRTFDPNIDEDMICRRIKKHRRPIRVVKYKSTSELTMTSDHCEGGIVTRGNSKNLLQTVTSCDRVLNVKKTNAMLSVITAVMSIALLFIIVLSGRLDSITSVYLLANQIFWMLPMIISAKLIVG